MKSSSSSTSVGRDDDDAVALELPRDRAGRAERAAVLRERVAHVGGRAVLVVGQRLDDHRDALGAVALVDDRLERRRRRRPRPEPLAIARSMLSFGIEYDFAFSIAFCEREVVGRVAAALLRRDDDRARQLREELAALRVGGALLVLDRRPLAMPGQADPPSRDRGTARGAACRRSAPGWNAATRKRPSRASTGWPSTSASTSTSGPASSIHGARMKTARSGSPRPRRRGRSRTTRPGGRRRCGARVTSTRPRWSRSSTIIPAHVPKTGAGEAAHRLVEAVEAHQARERRRLAARDHEAVEAVELLRLAHLDHVRRRGARSIAACSRKLPCTARTPIRSGSTRMDGIGHARTYPPPSSDTTPSARRRSRWASASAIANRRSTGDSVPVNSASETS